MRNKRLFTKLRYFISFIIPILFFIPYSSAHSSNLLDKRLTEEWISKSDDLLVLGQGLQDVIYKFDDEKAYKKYLSQFDIRQGCSNLVSKEVIMQVMRELKPNQIQIGGSANNTAVGVANLGNKVSFQTTVADDEMGKLYKENMQKYNMHNIITVFDSTNSTGIIMVIISPSGERTMLAHMGISKQIPIITNTKFMRNYKIAFSEGYLLNFPQEDGNLLHEFFKMAKAAGSITAFTFGDQYVVKKYHQTCLQLAKEVDIIFSDDQQIYEFFQTTDWHKITQAAKNYKTIFVITFGARGAYILHRGKQIYIPVQHVKKVIDTTGAGDQFAAGFLAGFIKGYDLKTCGNMGAKAAAHIIQQIGAKP